MTAFAVSKVGSDAEGCVTAVLWGLFLHEPLPHALL
jgi:hypothetical protein